jgi:hypothetical protein
MLGTKLYFILYVNYIRPQAQELLGLVRVITSNFSSLYSLRILRPFNYIKI